MFGIGELKSINLIPRFWKIRDREELPALVISAFPACGKTTFYEQWKDRGGLTILDSDSSKFSWTKVSDTRVRNLEFPANYIQHIKDNLYKADIIFVSSHLDVRKALAQECIPYVCVYPRKDLKVEWLDRCRKRGSSPSFVDTLNDNWDNWIDSCMSDAFGALFELQPCHSTRQDVSALNEEVVGYLQEAHKRMYEVSKNLKPEYYAVELRHKAQEYHVLCTPPLRAANVTQHIAASSFSVPGTVQTIQWHPLENEYGYDSWTRLELSCATEFVKEHGVLPRYSVELKGKWIDEVQPLRGGLV